MKKKKVEMTMQALQNISLHLTRLGNSMTVILGTPEESCEHYIVDEVQKEVCELIKFLAKH